MSTKTNRDLCRVLSLYPKAISHLRWQVSQKRFGPVLGAGVSVDFGVPGWSQLVTAIAADDQVRGKTLLNGRVSKNSYPYKTEMLFQRFRSRHPVGRSSLTALEKQNTILADWLKLCQSHLYGKTKPRFESEIAKHPYLPALIPLVQESYVTVNFNFDDILERALSAKRREKDVGNRGFEAVTDPWPQFRRTDAVIYHPHGYVPFGLMENAVDRFVFSEASYSKQYVGARGHDTSFLLAHFARHTCLLIGCSLEDELRSVLMRGAEINPGNYHYYVHYVREGASLAQTQRDLIAETNFKVYNLVTLFLTSKEINCLLKLISTTTTSDSAFKDLALQCKVQTKYTYYMTGPIGVGKSTTTSQLRNLSVLDEWQEKRPEILGKPWDELTPTERRKADNWIIGQFKKKNDTLRHMELGVISVVDRPPLDPLVFTSHSKRPQKAKRILDTLCPGGQYDVEKGMVILLLGDPSELSARVRATGRQDYTSSKLMEMQENMKKLYGKRQGVITIETMHMNIAELTKRVAEVIHREPYAPADLTAILEEHKQGAHAAA